MGDHANMHSLSNMLSNDLCPVWKSEVLVQGYCKGRVSRYDLEQNPEWDKYRKVPHHDCVRGWPNQDLIRRSVAPMPIIATAE